MSRHHRARRATLAFASFFALTGCEADDRGGVPALSEATATMSSAGGSSDAVGSPLRQDSCRTDRMTALGAQD